jgi:hypothetical protein
LIESVFIESKAKQAGNAAYEGVTFFGELGLALFYYKREVRSEKVEVKEREVLNF